jgi:hypothetical protein
MTIKNGKKLYVSLDSLLDTRLGVLNTIDVDFATDVTLKESYFTRVSDTFKNSKGNELNKELFNKVLNELKELVLRNSFKTKMHVFLVQLCYAINIKYLEVPVPYSFSIDINTYPFTLNDNEIKDLLESIVSLIGKDFDINVVSLAPNQLTIDYVKDNYQAMIMYNYHDWLNLHNENLKKKKLTEVTLYVPKIYFGSIPSKNDLEELDKVNKDPFDFNKEILRPILSIEYLPISLYSVDIPLNKPEYSHI